MSFGLSVEQDAIGEAIREFMAAECPREVARALDAEAAFPGELLERLAALGFCGLNVPEEYGGGGSDLPGTALVIAELARLAPALAIGFSAGALRGSRVIAEWGSRAQQEELLPPISSGRMLVTFAAEWEDETAICADETASGYRLNGAARGVTLAERAGVILTLARTPMGFAAFLVPAASPGLHLTPVQKVGTRGASASRVQFEQVALPRDRVLGGREQIGRGDAQRNGIRALEAIETAALCLGIAEGALDYASRYAEQRVQFGKPIVSFEAIQHLLVDMATDAHGLRLMLVEACCSAVGGAAGQAAAAMARLTGVRVARQTALQCLHILGGYGYMMEYDAQRYVRDALALAEGSESVEVIKNELGAVLGFGGGRHGS